jgi:hypothetical protein
MMGKSRSRRRAEAGLLTDLELALSRSPRAICPALPWRWRYELILAIGVPVVIIHLLGTGGGLLGVTLLAFCIGLWSPSREVLAARAWCIITPHRVRAGCVQARIYGRNGRLPFIFRTTLQPFGERVLIWCTAGTTAEDFQSATSILRTACWASDVRITRSPRHAHLITLDVIRYQATRTGA